MGVNFYEIIWKCTSPPPGGGFLQKSRLWYKALFDFFGRYSRVLLRYFQLLSLISYSFLNLFSWNFYNPPSPDLKSIFVSNCDYNIEHFLIFLADNLMFFLIFLTFFRDNLLFLTFFTWNCYPFQAQVDFFHKSRK